MTMSDKIKYLHLSGFIISQAILWLLLSGHYTPLLLGLGSLSILLVAIISSRMNLIAYHQPEIILQFLKFIPYCFWLLVEILKSNIDVCKRILNPALPIKPSLITIKASQRSEVATVAFANSITLTPGTISIDVNDNMIEVHSLSDAGIEGLETDEMNKRVKEAEKE